VWYDKRIHKNKEKAKGGCIGGGGCVIVEMTRVLLIIVLFYFTQNEKSYTS
jgi:hypothetical protein